MAQAIEAKGGIYSIRCLWSLMKTLNCMDTGGSDHTKEKIKIIQQCDPPMGISLHVTMGGSNYIGTLYFVSSVM